MVSNVRKIIYIWFCSLNNIVHAYMPDNGGDWEIDGKGC